MTVPIVTQLQRFAMTHDVYANFSVHRARRPLRQHDQKTEKGIVKCGAHTCSTDHYRIYWCLLYNTGHTVACQIQDRFHDDMLGIFQEMDN